ncbi:hypothetical protein [Streptomyces sp900105755]|uniref:Uncharacterized protein n=1 Tax=Streptomyces sp. 900105755 TaxID=3154389 RepID=A0ABV1TDN0_9ACTN
MDRIASRLREATGTGDSSLQHHWMRPDPLGAALVLYMMAPSLESAEREARAILRRALASDPSLRRWQLDRASADLIVSAMEELLWRRLPDGGLT